MTTLKFTTYPMMAADLGEENCNPDIKNIEYIHAGYRYTEKVTAEERQYLGKGMIDTILPYTILDQYNRERKQKDFPAAVLENEFLRATFLPSVGGRLWSLYDKRMERELLYVNPVFQPGNLAIRNAWFSGGVEWNVGIKGHNPLTCDPLFAEFAESETGEPVLRMYEYERIRRVVFSIEAYMPVNQPVLYVRNTIENTLNDHKYTYWWSNIAVPENRETRVIVPATDSFLCHYNEGAYVLDKTPVPLRDGVDYSYPKNSARSQDFFYKIHPQRAKWIAAVEEDGKGLLQFSQSRLMGRKVFLWGQGAGGRHWGEFLSDRPKSYIEIQAGLAHTQLEHIPMNGPQTIQWIEGYCAADITPEQAHGDWETAQAAIETQLAQYVALDKIDTALEKRFPTKLKNRRIVHNGSGWGYIEGVARAQMQQPPVSTIYDFPEDSATSKEKQWLTVLQEGRFVDWKVADIPNSFMVYPEWLEKIEAAAEKTQTWYGFVQLGIAAYANQQMSKAKKAFEKSLILEENPWAYRNLAMLAKNEDGDIEGAADLMEKALVMGCLNRGLVVNYAQVMIADERYEAWLKAYKALPQELQEDGRLRFYQALALQRLGRNQEAAAIITPDFVMCDIKEGEVSISHLWKDIYSGQDEESHPLPYNLDFRMHE